MFTILKIITQDTILYQNQYVIRRLLLFFPFLNFLNFVFAGNKMIVSKYGYDKNKVDI